MIEEIMGTSLEKELHPIFVSIHVLLLN